MKNILFVVGFLLSGNLMISNAQKTVMTYPLTNDKSEKNYTVKVLALTDDVKNTVALGFVDKNKVEYILFSDDFKVLSKITAPLGSTVYAYETQVLRTWVANKQGFNFIYGVKDKSLGKTSHFRIETVNFDTKKITNKHYLEIPGEESVIEYFQNGELHYLITCNDKTDELIFNILSPENVPSRKRVTFNLKEFYNQKKQLLSEYLMYSNSFGPAQETSLKVATDLTKFFKYPDKFVVLVTNYKEPPHILEIDLNTFKLKKRKLSLEGFCASNINNSYIFEGKLYVLNVCKEAIEIGVFDPSNDKLLSKHVIRESDALSFLDNPTKNTSVGRREREKDLSAKELIIALSKGSVGIAVSKNINGNVVLTCGTYDETSVGGGGYYAGGFSTTNAPTGQTHTGSNVPVTRPVSTFDPNKNYKTTKSTKATFTSSFRMVLDKEKLSVLEDQPVESRFDKMMSYYHTSKAPVKNLIGLKGKIFFGYFDAQKMAYVIEEIGMD